jgi:hypothetical protein
MRKRTVLPRMRLVGENFHHRGEITCAQTENMDTLKGMKWMRAFVTSGWKSCWIRGNVRGFYGQAALALRWICGSSNCLACALLHTLRQGLSPGELPALSAQPQ